MNVVTREEHREHLKTGIGDACLVCDEKIVGNWTDYNGEIKCMECGTTYQILGSHHTDEFLTELGLTQAEVARKYCNCFDCVPVLRDYWQSTHRSIPFGSYFGGSPIPAEDYDAFYSWLASNAPRLREAAPNTFHWDKIIAKYELEPAAQ